uniref:SPRY domain-containing SOCS box protein 3 n=1 Tax=Cacopsylla melanoneura TaxID=428564 RepID=A0A8D9AJY0_9HEMI
MDVNNVLSCMILGFKDGKFCDCYVDACRCGENFKEYEWVWDTHFGNPETIVLSCQNRETLFHPRTSYGTAAIRGTSPFQKGHVYYWEIKMLTFLRGTDIVVGVGTEHAAMSSDKYCSLIGSTADSWGYSFQGKCYHNGEERNYGSNFTQGSIVGVKLDMWSGDLEFYLNRKPLGVAFKHLNQYSNLYPMVCSSMANCSVRMIHSTSHPVDLMYHCLSPLRDQYQLTRDQLSGIPALKQFLKTSWWTFSDEEALYPDGNGSRKKQYHWSLPSRPQGVCHRLSNERTVRQDVVRWGDRRL